MKRVGLAAAVVVVGAGLAIWAIASTFQPGSVTRLELSPEAPFPQAPEVPPKAERRAASEPVKPNQTDTPAGVRSNGQPAFGTDVRSHTEAGPAGQTSPAVSPTTATPPRTGQIPPPSLRFETFEEVKDAAVYSDRDADVTPPIAVGPKQLGRVPLGVRGEDVARIEVLINANGTVSEVRATESPRTLDEAMLITMSMHAAKSWKFEPAQKDGRPVRYRQMLQVSLR